MLMAAELESWEELQECAIITYARRHVISTLRDSLFEKALSTALFLERIKRGLFICLKISELVLCMVFLARC